jgi:hypothetical protein
MLPPHLPSPVSVQQSPTTSHPSIHPQPLHHPQVTLPTSTSESQRFKYIHNTHDPHRQFRRPRLNPFPVSRFSFHLSPSHYPKCNAVTERRVPNKSPEAREGREADHDQRQTLANLTVLYCIKSTPYTFWEHQLPGYLFIPCQDRGQGMTHLAGR